MEAKVKTLDAAVLWARQYSQSAATDPNIPNCVGTGDLTKDFVLVPEHCFAMSRPWRAIFKFDAKQATVVFMGYLPDDKKPKRSIVSPGFMVYANQLEAQLLTHKKFDFSFVSKKPPPPPSKAPKLHGLLNEDIPAQELDLKQVERALRNRAAALKEEECPVEFIELRTPADSLANKVSWFIAKAAAFESAPLPHSPGPSPAQRRALVQQQYPAEFARYEKSGRETPAIKGAFSRLTLTPEEHKAQRQSVNPEQQRDWINREVRFLQSRVKLADPGRKTTFYTRLMLELLAVETDWKVPLLGIVLDYAAVGVEVHDLHSTGIYSYANEALLSQDAMMDGGVPKQVLQLEGEERVTTQWVSVPMQFVAPLVKTRSVFLRDGLAYVPAQKLHIAIAAVKRELLRRAPLVDRVSDPRLRHCVKLWRHLLHGSVHQQQQQHALVKDIEELPMPQCIHGIINERKNDVPTHDGRYALASYLVHLTGRERADKFVRHKWPGKVFRETKNANLASKSPPGCTWMQSKGLCPFFKPGVWASVAIQQCFGGASVKSPSPVVYSRSRR